MSTFLQGKDGTADQNVFVLNFNSWLITFIYLNFFLIEIIMGFVLDILWPSSLELSSHLL